MCTAGQCAHLLNTRNVHVHMFNVLKLNLDVTLLLVEHKVRIEYSLGWILGVSTPVIFNRGSVEPKGSPSVCQGFCSIEPSALFVYLAARCLVLLPTQTLFVPVY